MTRKSVLIKRWHKLKKALAITPAPGRVCHHCDLEKPITDFAFNHLAPGNRHYNCLVCEAILRHWTGVKYNQTGRLDGYKYPELIEANRLIKALNKKL